MDRRAFLQRLGMALSVATLPGIRCRAKRKRPNFIVILADDLGWPQISLHGSEYYQTPNIDRLAQQGMHFTDAYAAAPVCSPTRASLMTGQYPARLHITDFIAGGADPKDAAYRQPKWQKWLPLEQVTLGENLQAAGYATALFGKWHLSPQYQGAEAESFNPLYQGFAETLLTFKPKKDDDPEKDAHNVQAITDHALAFLDKHRDQPFLLYIPHNTVHDPVMEKGALVEKYRQKPGVELSQNNPILAAMVETLDRSVGAVLDKLDELQLTGKTMVIFYSDNGGLEKVAAQTPFRSGKANLYEGGIRVPLIVRWPGTIRPGSTSREPVTTPDLYATILELAGVPMLSGPVDGKSLVPLLTAKAASLEREAIFWHYPHYHSAGIGPCGAVRAGDYKLIEWYDVSRSPSGKQYELYRLADDPGELHNLADQQPDKTAELARRLAKWRVQMGAQELRSKT